MGIHNKKKKKWRAVKRAKLVDFERKRLEELNNKLKEIAQTPLTEEVKMEGIAAGDLDPLAPMRLENRPKKKKAIVVVEMDEPTPAASSAAAAAAAASSSSSSSMNASATIVPKSKHATRSTTAAVTAPDNSAADSMAGVTFAESRAVRRGRAKEQKK